MNVSLYYNLRRDREPGLRLDEHVRERVRELECVREWEREYAAFLGFLRFLDLAERRCWLVYAAISARLTRILCGGDFSYRILRGYVDEVESGSCMIFLIFSRGFGI